MDYVALIAVLRGCYVGYKSGLFPELLRIAGYLITVIVTFHFHETLAQLLTLKTFLNSATASVVAFLSLLAVVFLLTKLVTKLLLKLLKVWQGNFIYRLSGLTIGAFRWVILLSLLFMAIDYMPLAPLKTDIHQRSFVGPKISQIAPMVFDFLAKLSPQLAVPEK